MRGFIIAIGFIFLFTGCKKDELTLPANVDFVFELNPFETSGEKSDLKSTFAEGENPQKDKGNQFKDLIIDNATAFITSIEIEGIREQGGDVFLISEFDPPVEINLQNEQVISSDISFDIPQGVYEKLDIQFNMGDATHPALDFQGSLNQGNSSAIQFRFSYVPMEIIQVRATRVNPSEKIVLDKHKNSQAKVTLNAEYLFQNFTLDHLNDVTAINTNNGKEVRVNNKNNKSVFGLMTGRLEQSISVIFE
ncbi:hypothetical protein [Marinilabilia rubra]|nr:hypothetical protein [Marinilabilia rubra]